MAVPTRCRRRHRCCRPAADGWHTQPRCLQNEREGHAHFRGLGRDGRLRCGPSIVVVDDDDDRHGGSGRRGRHRRSLRPRLAALRPQLRRARLRLLGRARAHGSREDCQARGRGRHGHKPSRPADDGARERTAAGAARRVVGLHTRRFTPTTHAGRGLPSRRADGPSDAVRLRRRCSRRRAAHPTVGRGRGLRPRRCRQQRPR
mmetsp:Transcript_46330/g.121567  ORF Transcript_46330/g.121567 Transcript_46330/m.121567 type:complete len:203 (+) Transcript_46330:1-609(+)